MASKVIYPPIIPNYLPAFETNDSQGECTIPFSLSKFNISEDFKTLHVSIMKQGNGKSIINNVDNGDRLRKNGKIILNVPYGIDTAHSNSYFFTITADDIYRNKQEIGATYKIQIRLSEEICPIDAEQNRQLNNNASKFSEWSTVCIIKAIGRTKLEIGEPFNFNSEQDTSTGSGANNDEIQTYSQDYIQFGGRVTNEDPSEKLYSYNLQLFHMVNEEPILIEDSGLLFSNKYQDSNEFDYFFKEEFQNEEKYKIVFTYTTINEYTGTQEVVFDIDYALAEAPDMHIITADKVHHYTEHYHEVAAVNDSPSYTESGHATEGSSPAAADNYNSLTSVAQEEEDGRIGLKLMSIEHPVQTGNFCIRRTDEKSNFTKQIDLKIIVLQQDTISDLDVIYDYTIESGVYYKYAVQSMDRNGKRSLMQEISDPIMRDFAFSFLLGENEKQLKLKFDNSMQNFKIQQVESKLESIGSKYPLVTRNAAVEYRTFPITGLISFQMDDNKLFFTRKEAYGKQNDIHTHNGTYDYIQERDFRNEVLRFLQDGKPKLFKSPTEGNIIVRLMDVNCTPNQSLSRMLYSFTSNALELDEANMDNYLKYNFYEVGEYASTFEKAGTALGQLSMTFTPDDDIISLIWDKYASKVENHNIGDLVKKIQKVYQIQITINDPPLRVQTNSGGIVLGNNIKTMGVGSIHSQVITIYNGIYQFDKNVEFVKGSHLYLLGDEKNQIKEVNANIDFIYDYTSEEYQGRKRISTKSKRGIGQIINTQHPGDSIQNMIYYKYYMDTNTKYSRLNTVPTIEIEANPGTIFRIKDASEPDGELHEINDTGTLRFYELSDIKQLDYYGMRNYGTDKEENPYLFVPATVSVMYYYTVLEGEYEKETD